MREKIRIPIKDVILNKKNIIEIAEYLFLQEDKMEVNYIIHFINDQEISSNDISIFENRKFEEYEIESINMHYRSNNPNKKITIFLYNYDKAGFSDIEVESDDSEWIAVIERELEEKISFCEKQAKIGKLFHKDIIPFILAVIISEISGYFLMIFLNKIVVYDNEQEIFLVSCLGMLILNILVFKNLRKAFPIIEISIHDKNNSAKKKRKSIVWLCTAIILPLILNAVYDLIKIITK